jgi:hypothetical protein
MPRSRSFLRKLNSLFAESTKSAIQIGEIMIHKVIHQ